MKRQQQTETGRNNTERHIKGGGHGWRQPAPPGPLPSEKSRLAGGAEAPHTCTPSKAAGYSWPRFEAALFPETWGASRADLTLPRSDLSTGAEPFHAEVSHREAAKWSPPKVLFGLRGTYFKIWSCH